MLVFDDIHLRACGVVSDYDEPSSQHFNNRNAKMLSLHSVNTYPTFLETLNNLRVRLVHNKLYV
jgi:hypothetical protein